MSSRVRAHSIETDEPSLAARRTAAALLADAPRARSTIVAAADYGAHPGLRPSPWVLDGVVRALEHEGLHARSVVLGNRNNLNSLADRLVAWGLPSAEHSREGAMTLYPPGSRRALRIPRDWVGSNLCLVLPCLHRQQPTNTQGHASGPAWRGPITTALLELVTRWGRLRTRDSVGLAGSCIAEIFAHVSVVIDASWWAPLAVEDEGAPLLLSPQRTLGVCLTSAIDRHSTVDPSAIDSWLGHQLGLPLRRRGEQPTLVGSAADSSWPKLPRSHGTTRSRALGPGLAGKNVAALWQRTDRRASRHVALPAAVPGAMAASWDDYQRSAPG